MSTPPGPNLVFELARDYELGTTTERKLHAWPWATANVILTLKGSHLLAVDQLANIRETNPTFDCKMGDLWVEVLDVDGVPVNEIYPRGEYPDVIWLWLEIKGHGQNLEFEYRWGPLGQPQDRIPPLPPAPYWPPGSVIPEKLKPVTTVKNKPLQKQLRTHKVVSGDNLANIAKAHNTTVDRLVAANLHNYPKITKGKVQNGWVLIIR